MGIDGQANASGDRPMNLHIFEDPAEVEA